MKHQPYETWILDETPLNENQIKELGSHLRTCSSCSILQASWQRASEQIKKAPARQPSPGFAARWQASLNERKVAEERKQRRNVLIWIACVTAAVLLSLAVIILPRISLLQAIIDLVESLVGFTAGVSTLITLLTSLLRSVPPYALILTSLGLSTLLCITIFLWGISIWRMSRKGVTHNEEI